MDFLWHKVSDKEKEQIKKQAKEIIDSFSKKLGKIELGEGKVQRKEQLRKETKSYCSPEFRKLFMDNAPSKDDNFIKAEKGSWRK